MQKLTLAFLDTHKDYEPIECIGPTINLLEYFLHDISPKRISVYIDWAQDPKQDLLGAGNTSYLEKEDDKILVSSVFSEQKDGGPFFTLPVDQFIKLLTIWQQLVENGTQKITITEQDGQITIEGE